MTTKDPIRRMDFLRLPENARERMHEYGISWDIPGIQLARLLHCHNSCQLYQCDTYATLMNKMEKYGMSQKIILDNIRELMSIVTIINQSKGYDK